MYHTVRQQGYTPSRTTEIVKIIAIVKDIGEHTHIHKTDSHGTCFSDAECIIILKDCVCNDRRRYHTIRSPSSLVRHLRTVGCPRTTETLVGQVASKYGLLIASGGDGMTSATGSTPGTSVATFSTLRGRSMTRGSWRRFNLLAFCCPSSFHSLCSVGLDAAGSCNAALGADHG